MDKMETSGKSLSSVEHRNVVEHRHANVGGSSPSRIVAGPAVERSEKGGAGNGRQAGAAGHLGKSGTTFHPTQPEARDERQQRRAEKFQFRQGLREYATRKTVQLCGSRACSASGVGVRLTESEAGRRAGFAGLSTCGSIWLCPVCAAKIAARRAEELGTVLENVREAGYQLAMVTLTVRHKATDSLEHVWAAVSSGWHRATGGKAWLADKQHYEIPGWVKAVEVTHGKHGWHVHIHTVIAYKGTPNDAKALGQRIYCRWEAGLKRVKVRDRDPKTGRYRMEDGKYVMVEKEFTALPDYGLDVEVSQGGDLGNLGKYLSKLGADLQGTAREVTQGSQKEARGTNRTPFQIGYDLVEEEAAEDRVIWNEWQKTAPGHRALSWSKGFREEFGLVEKELTDEEIAAEEVGTKDDTVCLIPSPAWYGIKHRAWEILDVAENSGAEALRVWLTEQGIDWTLAPDRLKLMDAATKENMERKDQRTDPLTDKEYRAVRIGRAAVESGRATGDVKVINLDRAVCSYCGETMTGCGTHHVACHEEEMKRERVSGKLDNELPVKVS